MLNCWAILLEIWEHTTYTLSYPEIFWEYMSCMEYTLSEQRWSKWWYLLLFSNNVYVMEFHTCSLRFSLKFSINCPEIYFFNINHGETSILNFFSLYQYYWRIKIPLTFVFLISSSFITSTPAYHFHNFLTVLSSTLPTICVLLNSFNWF